MTEMGIFLPMYPASLRDNMRLQLPLRQVYFHVPSRSYPVRYICLIPPVLSPEIYTARDQDVALSFTIPSAIPYYLYPLKCTITTGNLYPVEPNKNLQLEYTNGGYQYVYWATGPGTKVLNFRTSLENSDETVLIANEIFQTKSVEVKSLPLYQCFRQRRQYGKLRCEQYSQLYVYHSIIPGLSAHIPVNGVYCNPKSANHPKRMDSSCRWLSTDLRFAAFRRTNRHVYL